MDVTEKVLEVMRSEGETLNAGKIAELGGLDRKDVDKAMTKLKKRRKDCFAQALLLDTGIERALISDKARKLFSFSAVSISREQKFHRTSAPWSFF